jgi:predicted DNA-binding transcriptional regulator YafY
MGRASDTQRTERLNRARDLLRQSEQLPDAVERLAHDCSISPGQAYRYLQQAQRLKEPVAVAESKLAFTVKLPRSLIQRVRLYASVKGLSISEVVNRTLLTLQPRGRGRGRG